MIVTRMNGSCTGPDQIRLQLLIASFSYVYVCIYLFIYFIYTEQSALLVCSGKKSSYINCDRILENQPYGRTDQNQDTR